MVKKILLKQPEPAISELEKLDSQIVAEEINTIFEKNKKAKFLAYIFLITSVGLYMFISPLLGFLTFTAWLFFNIKNRINTTLKNNAITYIVNHKEAFPNYRGLLFKISKRTFRGIDPKIIELIKS